MTFSAKTNSLIVQNQIASKMTNLRREVVQGGITKKKICLIPKNPKQILTVFVDDINMPEIE